MDQRLSELNVLASAKPNAYLLVIDPDEALDENKGKRILLSTLSTGGSDNTNFGPYDPNVYYSKDAPDYVSYNGNTYEYINATAAKGKTPGSQPTYWKLASSGAFTHNQNTDTSTNSRVFEIGKINGTIIGPDGNPVDEPTGEVVLVFGGANGGGGKVAIRHRWEDSGGTHSLQQCLNYSGSLLDVWSVIGGGGDISGKLDILAPTTTGTALTFLTDRNYGTFTAPVSGNITFDLTNAIVGVMNKMYHSSGTAPTIGSKAIGDNSGTAQRMVGTAYELGVVNIIHFVYCPDGKVEYWISKRG